MKLSDLAKRIPGSRVVGAGDAEVARVVHDSRGIRRGDLYVALVGTRVDGHEFVQPALEAGAVAAWEGRHPRLMHGGTRLRPSGYGVASKARRATRTVGNR